MGFFSTMFGGGSPSVPQGTTKEQTTAATGGLGATGTSGLNFMNSYGAQGQQGLNAGLNHLTPVTNWFQSIMSGNKAATLNQMQPQIQQINQGQNQALQTASTLAPRGGGRSATLFDQPFQAQKQIAEQYAGARAGAPAGLQSAATAEGALGSAAGGLGSAYGGVGAQANNGLLNYGLNQQQQAYGQAQQNGGLFGKLISPLLNAIPGFGPAIGTGIKTLFGGNKSGQNADGTGYTTLKFPGMG